MDQLMWASLSHTRYWYEVGMSKVPAWYVRLIICGVVTGYIVQYTVVVVVEVVSHSWECSKNFLRPMFQEVWVYIILSVARCCAVLCTPLFVQFSCGLLFSPPEALIKVCSAIKSCALMMMHTLLQSNK